jgi:hypothetical protein
MAVTQDDLNDFQRFANAKLSNGGVESMDELVAAWHEHRAHMDSLSSLEESHADAEAGRIHPAEEVIADARKTLGRR